MSNFRRACSIGSILSSLDKSETLFTVAEDAIAPSLWQVGLPPRFCDRFALWTQTRRIPNAFIEQVPDLTDHSCGSQMPPPRGLHAATTRDSHAPLLPAVAILHYAVVAHRGARKASAKLT